MLNICTRFGEICTVQWESNGAAEFCLKDPRFLLS